MTETNLHKSHDSIKLDAARLRRKGQSDLSWFLHRLELTNTYEALESASSTLEITGWLLWFADATMEAQRRTVSLVELLLSKARMFNQLRGHLNPRQERALLRMFREGPEGFKGGLSASNYMKITGASSATSTRDLADLVEKGALIRQGEKRHARYHLDLALMNSRHLHD